MKKHSVGLLELETAVLECFLEKTPLSPLGVKDSAQFWRQDKWAVGGETVKWDPSLSDRVYFDWLDIWLEGGSIL
jgi:hypothetical protein